VLSLRLAHPCAVPRQARTISARPGPCCWCWTCHGRALLSAVGPSGARARLVSCDESAGIGACLYAATPDGRIPWALEERWW